MEGRIRGWRWEQRIERVTSYSTLCVTVKKLDFHSHVSQNRFLGSWNSCVFFRMTLYLDSESYRNGTALTGLLASSAFLHDYSGVPHRAKYETAVLGLCRVCGGRRQEGREEASVITAARHKEFRTVFPDCRAH